MEAPQPIQPTDYDTCWMARLTETDGSLAYPDLLDSLMNRQHPDGSWGSQVPYIHDRLLTTLAIVLLLARSGNRRRDLEKRRAGERYIWRHAGLLHYDAHKTIGFEMILPTLLSEGQELGLNLPYTQLRHYEAERARKLSLLPMERIFHTQTSATFSLEAFAGNVDLEGASGLLLENGSMSTSPAATAFFLDQVPDWRSRYPESVGYLEGLLASQRGGVPTVAPTDVFARVWMLYNLRWGGLLDGRTESAAPHYKHLQESLGPEGLGWASISLPESDNTATGLLVLRRAGYEADGSCLLGYERDRHFAVLSHELDPSVSANLHILEAIQTFPEKDRPRVRDKILDYLIRARHYKTFWSDKWHASTYYPTSIALMVLPPYLPDKMESTLHWLLSTQHINGAWGQYGSTAEETALVLLALLNYHRTVRSIDREPLRQAAEYLLVTERPLETDYPELWVSKTLYAPAIVIRSTIIAALGLYYDTFGEPSL